MSYPLEPPYTRSGMHGMEHQEAVTEGPLLARSRGSSRWHRVKSGVRYTNQGGRICWHYWCGQAGSSTSTVGRDDLPTDGLPICGLCEGKALGAGYNGTAAIIAGEALLLFEPESTTKLRTPSKCPGSGRTLFLPAEVPADRLVALCAVCGLHVPLGPRGRGRGYSYYGWEAPKDHAPGDQLIDPCPFHAWDELMLHDGTVICRCSVIRAEEASA